MAIGMIEDIQAGVVSALLQLKDDGFYDGLNQASSALQNLETTANESSKQVSNLYNTSNLSRTASAFSRLGSTFTSIAEPAVDLAKSSVDTFTSMQSAFTGVRKTINEDELLEVFGTAEQGYKVLDEGIRRLTQETGSTYEEIAAVMEMAGQLNIPLGEAGKGLLDFTKMVIMLNDTTNLMGEDAAKQLAQFANIMGTTTDEYMALGSAIVDVGNNSATTEADIMNMAMRLSAAGKSIGMTEADIVALSASLSSVGIRAEMGGSAYSKVMKKMANASVAYDDIIKVQNETGKSMHELEMMMANQGLAFIGLAENMDMPVTKLKEIVKNGVLLQNFADVANMSMEEFAKTFQEDAVTAIGEFTLGLGDTESKGKSVIEMLQDMGFTEVRTSDVLARLSLAQGEFGRIMELSNKAWEESTALQIEADKRYEDLQVKITRLKETWEFFKYDLAEILVPLLQRIMDFLTPIIQGLSKMPGWVKGVALAIPLVIGALGGLLTTLGNVLFAVKTIMEFRNLLKAGSAVKSIGDIASAIGGVKDNCHKVGSCMAETAGKVGKVGGAFSKVAGIVGTVIKTITGIAAVIGGLVLAGTSFFDMWENGWSLIKTILEAVGLTLAAIGAVILGAPAAVAAAVAGIVFALSQLVIVIHDHWDSIKQWGHETWESIKKGWNDFVDALSKKHEETKEKFRKLGEEIKGIFSGIGEWFKEKIDKLKERISKNLEEVKEAFGNVIEKIKEKFGPFIEWWQGLGENLKNIWNNVCEFLFGGIEKALSNIRGAINKWFNEHFGSSGLFTGIPAIFQRGIQMIVGFLQSGVNLVHDILVGFFNILVDLFTLNFDKLVDDFNTLVFNIKADLSDVAGDVYDFFVTVWNTITTHFSKVINEVTTSFNNIINYVRQFASNLLNDAKQHIENLRNSIKDGLNGVKEVAENVVNRIKEVFNNFVNHLKQNFQEVKEAFSNILEFLKEHVSKIVETIKGVAEKAIGKIKEIWQNIIDVIKNFCKEASTKIEEFTSNLHKKISELPSKLLEAGKNAIKGFAEGVKVMWEEVVQPFLEDKFGWIFDIIGKIKSGFSSIGDFFNGIGGSHANGLDYVPYDNYIARLHKGERVLTKEENERYNSGGNVGGDTFNFYNTQPDPYEYARQMKRAKKELLYT